MHRDISILLFYFTRLFYLVGIINCIYFFVVITILGNGLFQPRMIFLILCTFSRDINVKWRFSLVSAKELILVFSWMKCMECVINYFTYNF